MTLRAHARVVTAVAGLAVLVLIGVLSRDAVVAAFAGVSLPVFAAAIGAGLVFSALQGAVFDGLLRKHGATPRTREVLGAFLASQPAKYVPGKIWPALLQAASLRFPGAVFALGVANIESALLGMVQTAALGAACLLYPRPAAAAALLAGLALAWLLVRAPSNQLRRWLPRRLRASLGEARAESADETPPPRTHLLFALSLGANLVASWLVLVSMGDLVPPDLRLPVLAVLYLGVAAGILAVPVPAGVGVRETAIVGLGLVFVPELPAATLVAIGLVARAWQLALDAACLVAGWWLLGARRPDA